MWLDTVDGERLEGREYRVDEASAAVIAHPHPLHGGTMANKVVTTTTRSLAACGASTLRFNFRGVGKSTGAFDDGVAEVYDLRAGIKRVSSPGSRLVVAGFSFGSMVVRRWLSETELEPELVILIGLPVAHWTIAPLEAGLSARVLVLAGANDEFAPQPALEAWAAASEVAVELAIVPETGHFFHGQLDVLASHIHAAAGGSEDERLAW